jgi:hypothetical protein
VDLSRLSMACRQMDKAGEARITRAATIHNKQTMERQDLEDTLVVVAVV